MMKMLMTLAVATVLGLGLGSAHADNGAKPADASAKKTTKAMTLEQLVEMLENLGYQPEPIKDAKGNTTGYSIKYTWDGWNMELRFLNLPQVNLVYIASFLCDAKDADAKPASLYTKLLKGNGDYAPATFAIVNNQLYLVMPVAALDMTPATLRKNMETVAAIVKQSAPMWKDVMGATTTNNTQTAP